MLKQVQHDDTSNGHFNKAKRRRNLLDIWNFHLPKRQQFHGSITCSNKFKEEMLKPAQRDDTSNCHFDEAKRRRNLLDIWNFLLPKRQEFQGPVRC